jgi:hypothetical protein
MAGAGALGYIIAEGLVDAKAASDTVLLPPADEYVEPPEGDI